MSKLEGSARVFKSFEDLAAAITLPQDLVEQPVLPSERTIGELQAPPRDAVPTYHERLATITALCEELVKFQEGVNQQVIACNQVITAINQQTQELARGHSNRSADACRPILPLVELGIERDRNLSISDLAFSQHERDEIVEVVRKNLEESIPLLTQLTKAVQRAKMSVTALNKKVNLIEANSDGNPLVANSRNIIQKLERCLAHIKEQRTANEAGASLPRLGQISENAAHMLAEITRLLPELNTVCVQIEESAAQVKKDRRRVTESNVDAVSSPSTAAAVPPEVTEVQLGAVRDQLYGNYDLIMSIVNAGKIILKSTTDLDGWMSLEKVTPVQDSAIVLGLFELRRITDSAQKQIRITPLGEKLVKDLMEPLNIVAIYQADKTAWCDVRGTFADDRDRALFLHLAELSLSDDQTEPNLVSKLAFVQGAIARSGIEPKFTSEEVIRRMNKLAEISVPLIEASARGYIITQHGKYLFMRGLTFSE
jgi:hypothetical protein